MIHTLYLVNPLVAPGIEATRHIPSAIHKITPEGANWEWFRVETPKGYVHRIPREHVATVLLNPTHVEAASPPNTGGSEAKGEEEKQVRAGEDPVRPAKSVRKRSKPAKSRGVQPKSG